MHAATIKPQPPARVDSLLQETLIQIAPLRSIKGETAKFRVAEPKLVQLGAKWCFGKLNTTVAKIEGDLVTLDVPMNIQMYKKSVKQKAWCTDPGWLYSQLDQFWSSYWNHSRPVEPSRTQYLVDALPQLPRFDPTVTAFDVKEAIRRLKLGKARGLDGFSNFELQCLHGEDTELMASLFNSVLQTGEWPDELCNGAVALVAKVEQPQEPKDGRPITVLSSLYRLFGKIFSTKILQHWLPHLPKSLYGSIPGRSSIDAAWQLASKIEEAMAVDSPLYGVSLDLSKAYNLLPRKLLMQMVSRTGWPPVLTQAYGNFLSKLKRYFRIADGLWGPVSSTVGVPEGCPLAVPCMIVVTWALSARVANLGVPLVSYVDNWSAQMWERAQIGPFLDEVARATQAMQMLLNPDKTRVYSTCHSGRAQLRAMHFQGFPLRVCLRLDDLGVDFNVGKQVVAATLLRRVEALQPRLARLQRTPWSHTRKAQVLLRTVHPAVSFGCEFSNTSPSTCSMLRGKYSAAIWGPHGHRSHFLTPLIGLEAHYEPFILFLLCRINTLRRVFSQHPSDTMQLWNLVVSAGAEIKSTGPMRYLVNQLKYLGWELRPDLMFLDSSGDGWHICRCSKAQIKDLVYKDWWKIIAAKLPELPAYRRAPLASFSVSLALRKIAKCSIPIVGSFTVGAAMSSDQKRHFLTGHDSLCKFCGSEDGYAHRLRACPHYAQARANIPAGFLDSLDDEILLRGLWPEPPEQTVVSRLLGALPQVHVPLRFTEPVQLFTDGSTNPHRFVPLSTWAVVHASPSSFENAVVEMGVLPGQQSNYRAELYALFVAVQLASFAIVYSDNLGVVLGFRVLLTHGWVSSRFFATSRN